MFLHTGQCGLNYLELGWIPVYIHRMLRQRANQPRILDSLNNTDSVCIDRILLEEII